MSADNGVYILHTTDGQYRVKEFQAGDNLYWNVFTKKQQKTLFQLAVVVEYADIKYTKNSDKAFKIANNIHNNLWICEYGISLINCNISWECLLIISQKQAQMVIDMDINYCFYQDFERDKFYKIADGYYLNEWRQRKR